MAYYTVTLYDADKTEIAVHHDVEGLKPAEKDARDLLADPEYKDCAHYVQVTNDNDVVVYDKFAKKD
jgi:predicted NUDIX family phosphoesterase